MKEFFGGVLLIGGLLGLVFGMITWATWANLAGPGSEQWVNPGSTIAAASAVSIGFGLWLFVRDDFPRRRR